MLLTSFRTMLVNLRTSNRKVQEGIAILSSTATELMATSAESASTMQETATAIGTGTIPVFIVEAGDTPVVYDREPCRVVILFSRFQ